MDDAGFAFLAEFPERSLHLHPDLHVFRAHMNHLRGEADPLLHLDDRYDIRLLHLELRRRIVDDRVGHGRPFACETRPLHLPDGTTAARWADGPRREVDLAAAPALRSDQVVAALDLPPEPRDSHLSPPARRCGPQPWPPCRPGCA